MRFVALHDLVSHHLTCIYALIGPTPGAGGCPFVASQVSRCVCRQAETRPSTTGMRCGLASSVSRIPDLSPAHGAAAALLVLLLLSCSCSFSTQAGGGFAVGISVSTAGSGKAGRCRRCGSFERAYMFCRGARSSVRTWYRTTGTG